MKSIIKSKAIRAALGSGGINLSGYIFRFLSTLIITRLLIPSDIAAGAMMSSILILFTLIFDFGIRQSILSSKGPVNQLFIETAWTVQIVRGSIISAFVFLIAISLDKFIEQIGFDDGRVITDPRMSFLVGLSSLLPIISSLSSLEHVRRMRELDYKYFHITTLINQILQFSFTIGLVFSYRSVFSIVWAAIFAEIFSVLATRYIVPNAKHRICWNREYLRELKRVGRAIMISSAITAVANVGDKLLLSAIVPAEDLAFYSIASTLVATIGSIFARMILSVQIPLLNVARRVDLLAFRKQAVKTRFLYDSLQALSTAFLFVFGDNIVIAIYDSRYVAAGQMVVWLSLSILLFRPDVSHPIYICAEKEKYLPWLSFANAASLIGTILLLSSLADLKILILGLGLRHLLLLPIYIWCDRSIGIHSWRPYFTTPIIFTFASLAFYAVEVSLDNRFNIFSNF